ncbi:unnamed protein product, partial [Musa textilis]
VIYHIPIQITEACIMRTSGLEVVQMTTKACWCATWVAFFPFPTPSSLTCFFNAPPPQARIC